MPGGNGIPRRSSGQAGPFGQGPGSGRGMHGGGRRPAQGGDNPEWLVNLVGTVALALGSVVIRALTRKRKSAPENKAETVDTGKDNN